MVTDPISDMLTRLRNGLQRGHAEIRIPYSTMKESIAKILASEQFIAGVKVEGEGVLKQVVLELDASQPEAITSLIRVSKPGRRVYSAAADIPRVLSGRGIIIISTSKGLMTGHDAKRQKLGGELICKVW